MGSMKGGLEAYDSSMGGSPARLLTPHTTVERSEVVLQPDHYIRGGSAISRMASDLAHIDFYA